LALSANAPGAASLASIISLQIINLRRIPRASYVTGYTEVAGGI
jgi:hypothetical protein